MASSVSHNASAPPPLDESHPQTQAHPTVAATTSAAAHITDDEAPRPQAGPLPRKRGEIGFREGMDVLSSEASASSSLPERHPADRDHPVAASPSSSSSSPPSSTTAPSGTSASGSAPADEPPRSPSRSDSTHSASSTGKRSLISFLKPKRIPTFYGLRITTLTVFLFELALFGATIAGWVLVGTHIAKAAAASASSSPPPSSDSNSTSSGNDDGSSSTTSASFGTTSSQIFVHIAFGLVALAELIFLERALFRLRAERYAHVHPGEVLPRTRPPPSGAGGATRDGAALGFAPWNRPPLPTYAAALAQAGVGTGDVEDSAIAVPPPPAYGNTRGSRLLLQGFLTDALRAQRPRSTASASTSAGSAWLVVREGGTGVDEERPKSYMSVDSEWEARLDADRALVLEETLARLEEGTGRRT